MRTVEGFKDYELIDADSGERLERWGFILGMIKLGTQQRLKTHPVR